MSERNDGGPAFPGPADDDLLQYYGMSLRDWFAGQVLAGMGGHYDQSWLAAERAYQIADAMLTERNK